VPDYLVVKPIKFRAQSTHDFWEVQLIDFGECKFLVPVCLCYLEKQCPAFFVGHSSKAIITPIPFHPPALVFKLGLTNAVDIWNWAVRVSIMRAHLSGDY